MDDSIVVAGFLVIVVGLFVAIKLAGEFQKIAESKGYTESKKFFWWTFLFPVYGMPMVIALPDLKQREYQEKILELVNKQQGQGISEEMLLQLSGKRRSPKSEAKAKEEAEIAEALKF